MNKIGDYEYRLVKSTTGADVRFCIEYRDWEATDLGGWSEWRCSNYELPLRVPNHGDTEKKWRDGVCLLRAQEMEWRLRRDTPTVTTIVDVDCGATP